MWRAAAKKALYRLGRIKEAGWFWAPVSAADVPAAKARPQERRPEPAGAEDLPAAGGPPRAIEPHAPQHFDVLFEDSHLLAVNKPSGLPTLPGGGFMENTLLHLVQKQFPNANPAHRLGRATTGIVLFAKTAQAASRLFADWNTPKIQKIYRALAQNVATQDSYEIRTSIGLVPHPLIGSVWAASPNGKPSKSLAKVVSRTSSTTTFEVSLHSGRPHQIRIHLASIGHPLVGDPLYGATGQPLENLPGLPGDGGYLLHAQYLNFHHPVTAERIHLEAPLPPGFIEPQ